MRRALLIGVSGVAAALASAGSGSATFPGRNGRIVFASSRASRPGEGNSQIFTVDLATGRSRNLSRSTVYDDRRLTVSPNGKRIAFLRTSPNANNNLSLWVMRADGSGQTRLVSGDVSDEDPAWSPDGTKIAFSADGDTLWVVNATGGGVRQLTTLITVGSPRWSPDGSEVLFAGTEGDHAYLTRVGVVGADGTGMRWLTGPGEEDRQPLWSPDGRSVAFVQYDELLVVGRDGTGERVIVPAVPHGASTPIDFPAWSPDGSAIVFLRADQAELVHPEGTGLHILAGGVYNGAPLVWSPTGDRLAFERALVQRGHTLFQLVVKRLGHAVTAVALPAIVGQAGLVAGPAWSPSGKSLFYVGVPFRRDLDLFSMASSGKRLRRLTRDNADDFDPAWSPDGRSIAFARGKVGELNVVESSLFLMNAAGSRVRRLTRGPLDTLPSWAPDGRQIVYDRGPDSIAVVDVKTGRLHDTFLGGSDPSWSPDGRLIAYAFVNELHVVRPDGRGDRMIFDGGVGQNDNPTGQIFNPSWSPNGRWITFTLVHDHGEWADVNELVVSRTGKDAHELPCPPDTSPPFLGDLMGVPGYGDDRIAWSPDGKSVIGSYAGSLWSCTLDGTPVKWLTPGYEPDWQSLH